MYELWFEILRDFTNYWDYMGLSSMVRLCKWSLLGLISYNLGGFVTIIFKCTVDIWERNKKLIRKRTDIGEHFTQEVI